MLPSSQPHGLVITPSQPLGIVLTLSSLHGIVPRHHHHQVPLPGEKGFAGSFWAPALEAGALPEYDPPQAASHGSSLRLVPGSGCTVYVLYMGNWVIRS